MSGSNDQAPLDGLRVLDFTRYVSGPYCTMLLSDAGAEVIKVEPEGGEISRYLEPFMTEPDGTQVSTYFLRFNRGKRSVTLDPRRDQDRPALVELIRSADILVENFRPGAMESWGLSWDELHEINPGLVYASISGFGHSDGKCRDWPAFNLVAEAMAGAVSALPMNGQRPRANGLPFGDSVTSLHTLSGILMAILRRHRTGLGSRVDIAMYDAMVSMNEWSLAVMSGSGTEVEIGREVHPWFAPYGLFEAADGWLAICVATDPHWQALCRAAGWSALAADPRLVEGMSRARHFPDLVKPALDEWLSQHTVEQVVGLLAAEGVPVAPLQRADALLHCAQAESRDMLVDMDVDTSASIRLAGNPIRVEPRTTSHATGYAAPGADNDALLDTRLAEASA